MAATSGRVGLGVIGLVTSRDEVSDLLALDGVMCATEVYLLSRQRPFRSSPEYWACTRLWTAAPRQVTLSDFTLLRRYGKGSYGQVFAARKEDTMALLYVPLAPPDRSQRCSCTHPD